MRDCICGTCMSKIPKSAPSTRGLETNSRSAISLQLPTIGLGSVTNVTRTIIWGGRKWNFSGMSSDPSGNGKIGYSINGSLKRFESVYGGSAQYNDPTVAERTMIANVMSGISEFLPIEFEYKADFNDSIIDVNLANSLFWSYQGFSPNVVGIGLPPGEYSDWTYDPVNPVKTSIYSDGCLYMNTNYAHAGHTNPGSWYYSVLLHEIGHAMGLAHPFDNGGVSTIMPGTSGRPAYPGKYRQNDFIYTVMTYRLDESVYGSGGITSYGYNENYGTIDVAALQWLYGRADSSGNKTFELNPVSTRTWKALYDSSGNNTIDASGSSVAVIIDTRRANLSAKSTKAGGYVSTRRSNLKAGFLLSNPTYIKNIVGSNYNDLINSGWYTNTIDTGAGNNTVNAFPNTTVTCGSGSNTVNVHGFNVDISSATFANVHKRKRAYKAIIVNRINKTVSLRRRRTGAVVGTFRNISSIKFKRRRKTTMARLYRIMRRRRRTVMNVKRFV